MLARSDLAWSMRAAVSLHSSAPRLFSSIAIICYYLLLFAIICYRLLSFAIVCYHLSFAIISLTCIFIYMHVTRIYIQQHHRYIHTYTHTHTHTYVYIYVYIYEYVYVYIIYVCIYIYMLGAGHRFSRPRGTGSVGDSVGEGQCRGIFSPQTSRYTLAFETLLSFAVVCCQLLSICAFKLCSQVVLSSCAIEWCYQVVLSNGAIQWCSQFAPPTLRFLVFGFLVACIQGVRDALAYSIAY